MKLHPIDRKMSYISEKPVSPKSGTLKSPPKGFDTSAINKSYYNVVSDPFSCMWAVVHSRRSFN